MKKIEVPVLWVSDENGSGDTAYVHITVPDDISFVELEQRKNSARLTALKYLQETRLANSPYANRPEWAKVKIMETIRYFIKMLERDPWDGKDIWGGGKTRLNDIWSNGLN